MENNYNTGDGVPDGFSLFDGLMVIWNFHIEITKYWLWNSYHVYVTKCYPIFFFKITLLGTCPHSKTKWKNFWKKWKEMWFLSSNLLPSNNRHVRIQKGRCEPHGLGKLMLYQIFQEQHSCSHVLEIISSQLDDKSIFLVSHDSLE